mmetsp:Transcript_94711/g.230086  ORF Transcript_94711/g.230086 Transcript_94711/m.230086 type:complete len:229 (+) Transcript_94711:859-1545(+)
MAAVACFTSLLSWRSTACCVFSSPICSSSEAHSACSASICGNSASRRSSTSFRLASAAPCCSSAAARSSRHASVSSVYLAYSPRRSSRNLAKLMMADRLRTRRFASGLVRSFKHESVTPQTLSSFVTWRRKATTGIDSSCSSAFCSTSVASNRGVLISSCVTPMQCSIRVSYTARTLSGLGFASSSSSISMPSSRRHVHISTRFKIGNENADDMARVGQHPAPQATSV